MFTSSGSAGDGGRGGGDAKTIMSPNTSFSDIINKWAKILRNPLAYFYVH